MGPRGGPLANTMVGTSARTRLRHEGQAPAHQAAAVTALQPGQARHTMLSAIRLEPVTSASEAALDRLVQLYFHDFSELDGEEVDESGRFDVPWLGEYLEQPGCAYFIRAGGKLAGFALVDQDVLDPCAMQAVSEFFVLRKYRLSHVGQVAAGLLMGTRPGAWEAAVIRPNVAASQFWEAVARQQNHRACTRAEWDNDSWSGPVFLFAPAAS